MGAAAQDQQVIFTLRMATMNVQTWYPRELEERGITHITETSKMVDLQRQLVQLHLHLIGGNGGPHQGPAGQAHERLAGHLLGL